MTNYVRFRNFILICLWAVALGSCSPKKGGSDSLSGMGVFTELAQLNFARSAHASETVNGKIYVLGGVQTGPTLLNSVEEYDPNTDVWTNKTSFPAPRFGMGSGVFNNKIYLFGGYRSAALDSNTVYEYEPATDTWSIMTPMAASFGYGLATTVGSYIYYFPVTQGGAAITAQARRYDPTLDTWTVLSSFAGQNLSGRHIVAAGTNIYFVGRNPIIVYDTVGDTWSNTLTSYVSTSNGGKNVALLFNKIYLLDESYTYSGVTEVFDVALQTAIPDYVHPYMVTQGAAAALGGSAYMSGGILTGNITTNKVYRFTPY